MGPAGGSFPRPEGGVEDRTREWEQRDWQGRSQPEKWRARLPYPAGPACWQSGYQCDRLGTAPSRWTWSSCLSPWQPIQEGLSREGGQVTGRVREGGRQSKPGRGERMAGERQEQTRLRKCRQGASRDEGVTDGEAESNMNRDCKTERDRLHMRISRFWEARNRNVPAALPSHNLTLPMCYSQVTPPPPPPGKHFQDGDELAMPVWLPSEGNKPVKAAEPCF